MTGRYLEFEMFPLTFDEYIGMKTFLGKSIADDLIEEFDLYLRSGGFPKAVQYDSSEDRRTYISGEQKYYLSDLGFYFATNTDTRINYGPVLENVIFTYARAHGYSTSIGRIGKLECDFILRRGDSEYSYVQACMTMAANRETEDREYAPLSKIRDNYPKYILTRNDPIQKRDGIIHKNLPQFMRDGTMF